MPYAIILLNYSDTHFGILTIAIHPIPYLYPELSSFVITATYRHSSQVTPITDNHAICFMLNCPEAAAARHTLVLYVIAYYMLEETCIKMAYLGYK